MTDLPPEVTIRELIDRYDALLIDAYGVLLHASGPFPGADNFIEILRDREFPFWVVTNDSSRLPETAASKYRGFGLPIEDNQVITSGLLIEPYFQHHGLSGANCAVLGTSDSKAYVQEAGGQLVDPRTDDFDVLVIGDDEGFSFRESMNAVITRLIHHFDAGHHPRMVLPNPDLIFQRASDQFGLASGSLAGMIETVLAERFPAVEPTFDPLGKPHPPIFQEAIHRADSENVALLGDQLATDIAGANRAGIDSVLVSGGVTNLEAALEETSVHPTYVMRSLKAKSGDEND